MTQKKTTLLSMKRRIAMTVTCHGARCATAAVFFVVVPVLVFVSSCSFCALAKIVDRTLQNVRLMSLLWQPGRLNTGFIFTGTCVEYHIMRCVRKTDDSTSSNDQKNREQQQLFRRRNRCTKSARQYDCRPNNTNLHFVLIHA